MKSINLVTKVEVASTFDDVKKKLVDFCLKTGGFNYKITICKNIPEKCYVNIDVPFGAKEITDDYIKVENVNTDKSLEQMMNDAIADSTSDYVVCTMLCDKNWEHSTKKVIENVTAGVDVCKVSKLFLPKSLFWNVVNTIIRIYYICIGAFIVSDRTLGATSSYFQGYSQKAIIIMKNFKEKMFHFRNEDCFLLLNQKNLFLKRENNSQTINHLVKKGLTKKQIMSFVAIFITIALIVVSIFTLLPTYAKLGVVLKFLILDIIIFVLGMSVAFYLFFSDEAKKITM